MEDWKERTRLLIGDENIKRIESKTVLVLGAGGVGGFVIESLVRSGIKNLGIICDGVVSNSNINRQIIAKVDTVGQNKTELFEKRLKEINPNINIYTIHKTITPENLESLINEVTKNIGKIDYIIDAIDSLDAKVENVIYCVKNNIKLYISMGAGFKLDTTKIKHSNIFNTKVCKLAKKIRQNLSRRIKEENLNKEDFKNAVAIFSEEEKTNYKDEKENDEENKNTNVASMIFIPASFGIKIASLVILDIINSKR